jgi:hypothetical protein
MAGDASTFLQTVVLFRCATRGFQELFRFCESGTALSLPRMHGTAQVLEYVTQLYRRHMRVSGPSSICPCVLFSSRG